MASEPPDDRRHTVTSAPVPQEGTERASLPEPSAVSAPTESAGQSGGARQPPATHPPAPAESPSDTHSPDEAAGLLHQIEQDQGSFRRGVRFPLWYPLIITPALAAVFLAIAIPDELAWARMLALYGGGILTAGVALRLGTSQGYRATGFRWRDNWLPGIGLLALIIALLGGSFLITRATGWYGWFIAGGVLAAAALPLGMMWLVRHDAARDRIDT